MKNVACIVRTEYCKVKIIYKVLINIRLVGDGLIVKQVNEVSTGSVIVVYSPILIAVFKLCHNI